MRHGQAQLPEINDRITSRQFQECLEIYNRCALSTQSRPSDAVRQRFVDYGAIVASDLVRSVDSATLLSAQRTITIDPLFREVERPYIAIPGLRLRPRTWGNLIILLWWLGLLGGQRSFRDAKQRARQGAKRLAHLAEQHGKVLLVGHGFMNTYIARELRALGWLGPRIPAKKYWEFGIYQRHDK